MTLLLKQPDKNKSLISLIASMIVKRQSPKLGLVHRTISILLYWNGTSKEVCIIIAHWSVVRHTCLFAWNYKGFGCTNVGLVMCDELLL